ncbi:COQ9 family protein [Roseospirillum parvum]|uniref:Ubiquinone biosynthesis protein COQ9 n=1 Tax=Roseospirillum parvum TaxID=83401 RepID=A0A1G7U2P7_9PROT|nr:COQ9 family protein [Roseospirillum parvum]SDG41080.1 ubiquinone biosynthesis protein COQ9 [Roseospirillum parvum]
MPPRAESLPQALVARNDAIVEAALTHVPFDGWTMAALRAGAVDAGLAAEQAELAFPGGGAEAVLWLGELADRRMVAALEAQADLMELPIRRRIHLAVRARLEPWTAHREALAKGLGVVAVSAAPAGLAAACRTVDAMWWAVGDASTDFNYYTKRASLAAVVAATTAFWLNDDTPETTATWDFLDRRIENVLKAIAARRKLVARVRELGLPRVESGPMRRRRGRRRRFAPGALRA